MITYVIAWASRSIVEIDNELFLMINYSFQLCPSMVTRLLIVFLAILEAIKIKVDCM